MASTYGAAQVLVASNRGPVSYTVGEGGSLEAKRGGGGLVSGLSAIGSDADALWVCSATIQRGGKMTKSAFARPGALLGLVSTVKIDGSGWSKLTLPMTLKRSRS